MTYSLRDFGSYVAGGRIVEVTEGVLKTIEFTPGASYTIDPRGHFAVEQAYVQYFIPGRRNAAPPVVLVHGGGLTGACWETTPDGRPGWLHGLLARGFEVHVMDAVERGRAGFAPDLWPGRPVLRSMEEAWTLFRIGPPEGFAARKAFARQRFPIAAFETFARSFVPRWFGTAPAQIAALRAVLARTGPALIVCHSQGSELALAAQAAAPGHVAALVALEPTMVPETVPDLPIVLVTGDFLGTAPFWRDRLKDWTELAEQPGVTWIDAAALGGGNSHMLMMDDNADAVLAVVCAALSVP